MNLISSIQNKLLENNSELTKNEKIKLTFINKEFDKFEFKLEYAFIVTEPEYNDN